MFLFSFKGTCRTTGLNDRDLVISRMTSEHWFRIQAWSITHILCFVQNRHHSACESTVVDKIEARAPGVVAGLGWAVLGVTAHAQTVTSSQVRRGPGLVAAARACLSDCVIYSTWRATLDRTSSRTTAVRCSSSSRHDVTVAAPDENVCLVR